MVNGTNLQVAAPTNFFWSNIIAGSNITFRRSNNAMILDVPAGGGTGSTNMAYLWLSNNLLFAVSNSPLNSGNITSDFRQGHFQKLIATGDLNFTNVLTQADDYGKMVTLVIDPNGSDRNLVFNPSWKFLGVKPASIGSGNLGILSLLAYSNHQEMVVAAYSSTDATNIPATEFYEGTLKFGTNAGGGSIVYHGTNADYFILNTLAGDGGLVIHSNANLLTISNSSVAASPQFGTNAGGGSAAVFVATNENYFIFNTLAADGGLVIHSNDFLLTLSNSAADSDTVLVGTNIGGGTGMWHSNTPSWIQFNSLSGDGGIVVHSNDNLLTISNSIVVGNAQFGTNAGGGATAIFVATNEDYFIFNTLAADGGLVLHSNDNLITVSNSVVAGAAQFGTNAGGGATAVFVSTNQDYFIFNTLAADGGLVWHSNDNLLTISNSITTNGFVGQEITNGLATTNFVNAIIAPTNQNMFVFGGVATNLFVPFSARIADFKTIFITNNFTLYATNYSSNATLAVKLVPHNYVSNYTVTVDSSWQRYGGNFTNANFTVPSNKNVIVSLTSWETNASAVAAAYREQQ